MEKVKINDSEYLIKSATFTSSHVVKIDFCDNVPNSFGDLVILTNGGELASELKGFETIWKKEDKTIWLSDNKTVYPDDDAINIGIENGETVYQKVSVIETKLTETERELSNAQLAIAELVESSLN